MTSATQWTIELIRCDMTNHGSHWRDRDAMRFFGTRAGEQVYQGTGGVYFVTSEQPPHGPRKCSVRQFDPESNSTARKRAAALADAVSSSH